MCINSTFLEQKLKSLFFKRHVISYNEAETCDISIYKWFKHVNGVLPISSDEKKPCAAFQAKYHENRLNDVDKCTLN